MTSTSMKSARNLYIPSGYLPVITIANHAAIQTKNAAIPYTYTQISTGIASSSRKNAVTRLRCST